MKCFVILDRDGVINHDSADYIKTPEEWIAIDGSLAAIGLLTAHGIDVFVATNQAGVARGKLSQANLDAIHSKLHDQVADYGGAIRDLRFCPHHPDDRCECRKPKPGMLLELVSAHSLSVADGYYVGDSLKDLRAAEAAGCQGVLVLTGNGEETYKLRPDHSPVFNNLQAFAEDLVRKLHPRSQD